MWIGIEDTLSRPSANSRQMSLVEFLCLCLFVVSGMGQYKHYINNIIIMFEASNAA